jgi:hypothetical protein
MREVDIFDDSQILVTENCMDGGPIKKSVFQLPIQVFLEIVLRLFGEIL